ncbi:DUF21 domain-containing protein [Mycoplasmopsis mucosicanis]|uniref:DUF21 domain-containing protein n=1 Tax=Mycoplasmopsis mucosicanis TaxID=458208 RepID=A0A507SQ73_9BACT|nr:CNNM domain-containing protein [Mycoplasmopsis mucosicanis]TQC53960.1 DUF21 domain-containing protein [Mycoplasmopsis mucosicanis]
MPPNYLIYVLIPILIFLLACSSIFSAAETAYTSLNPGKLESMIDRKEFGARIIKKQYNFFNRVLALILICNNIANIGLSTAVAYLFSVSLPQSATQYSALISTTILTPVIVILGEIVPKLVAKSYPEKVAKAFCYILEGLYWIFFPICWIISKLSSKIYVTNTEQDVKNLIDVAHTEGVLEANESIMAQNALDLDATRVRKHYIKVKDLSYLNYKASISEALEMFKETNYSRLPIEKDGNFLGIVLLKDIFHLERGKVIDHLKTIPTVSANITLAKALEKMRSQRAQMSFVTNNNSSSQVLGVITIEDIIEEIVGEIYDEFDEEEVEEIFEISLELFQASGNVQMRKILSTMELDFELDESDLVLNLEQWAHKQVKQKLHKNTKFEFCGVFFKVISTPSTKHKHFRFEIEIGNNAPINIDTQVIS